MGQKSADRQPVPRATTLALIIIGGLTVGQFLPADWRPYMPGIATQAAVTVHRSAGLLSPGVALAVLTFFNCGSYWRDVRSSLGLERKPSRRPGRYCIRRSRVLTSTVS